MRMLLLAVALGGAVCPQSPVYLVHDEPAPMRALATFLEESGYPATVEDHAAFRKHMQAVSAKAIFMYVHGVLELDIEHFLITWT